MKIKSTFLLMFALLFSACLPSTPTPLSTSEPVATDPMPVPVTEGPVATEAVVTQSYTDDQFNFAFDYPASWMLDVVTLGDRAPHSIQLTSWIHEPGLISEFQEDGTVVNVVVQLWDPKGDLAAFTEQRMMAWSASDISIVSQEDVTFGDGRVAREFVVQSADGVGYFLFTVLGDQYLIVSGSGDIDVIRQVGRSLR